MYEIPFDRLIEAIRVRADDHKLPVIVSVCARSGDVTVTANGVNMTFPESDLFDGLFWTVTIAKVADRFVDLMKGAS